MNSSLMAALAALLSVAVVACSSPSPSEPTGQNPPSADSVDEDAGKDAQEPPAPSASAPIQQVNESQGEGSPPAQAPRVHSAQ